MEEEEWHVLGEGGRMVGRKEAEEKDGEER